MNFRDYIDLGFDENTSLEKFFTEASQASRYSIEVNFRSEKEEVLKSFAKICLGYVSAALKNNGYHVKQVYEQDPIRLIISTGNWTDGEWDGMVYYHPNHGFVIGQGKFDKDRQTVVINRDNAGTYSNFKKAQGDSAAEIAKELRNLMHHLRRLPGDEWKKQKLKAVSLKRGPK